MITDPLADMLTQIRNALAVKKPGVVLPYSKFKHSLANILEKQGWLSSVEILDELSRDAKPKPFKSLKLNFKYDESGVPIISGIKRVSKPGQRIYAKSSEINNFRLGLGATVLSTPKGLMTDADARKAKVGGEVICQIW